MKNGHLLQRKIYLCISEKRVNSELDRREEIRVRMQKYVYKSNYFSFYMYTEINQRSTKTWREIKVLSSV
jgi:hypothetical protein